jgi:hypothetical protein
MGLTIDEIRPFAMMMFLVSFLGAIVYITIQIYRDGHDLNFKKIVLRSSILIISLAIIYYLFTSFTSDEFKVQFSNLLSAIGFSIKWIIAVGIVLLFLTALIRIALRKNETITQPHWISFLSPLLPLFLILLFDVNFIAAFIVGLIYAFLTTYKKGRLNLFIQSCFEGGGVVMPAVVLMFGIGMLLVAIMGPGGDLPQYPNGWPVLNIIKPLMVQIVPTNALMYVLIFTVAAPLALYRGPLNVWGMGYGIAAVFLASGMNPGAVMGLLLAVGQIQGISDPTNTHNVWLANEMRVDVQKVLWNTIAYTWVLAVIGLIISSIMFM